MRFLRNCLAFFAVSLFVVGCAHKESDHVVSAKPGTIVQRTKRPVVAEEGGVATIKLTEKIEVKLIDGTVGFFVHFANGQRVFLAREPFPYGKFDETIGTLEPGVKIYTIPDMLTGVWRLADLEDKSLLGQACAMFIGTENVPFACIMGCWASSDTPQYMMPVIRPSGAIEAIGCDEPAGLMYVKVKETGDESVSNR